MNKKTQIISTILLMIVLIFLTASHIMAVNKISAVVGLNARIEEDTVYLNWFEVSGASGYEVYVYTPGYGYSNLGSVTKTTATLKGFKKGTTYKAKIRAYKKLNGSREYADFSNEVSITIKNNDEIIQKPVEPAKNPTKVVGLNARIEGGKAHLNWIKSSNTDGYEVHVYTPGYGYSNIGDVTGTVATLKGFELEKTYKVKIRAYKKLNGSREYADFSNEISIIIKNNADTIQKPVKPNEEPTKVVGLNARIQNERVYLNWIKSSNVDGYEVYVYVPGYGYSNLGAVTGTTATLRGFKKGTTYKAKIKAYKNVNGSRQYADFSSEVSIKF